MVLHQTQTVTLRCRRLDGVIHVHVRIPERLQRDSVELWYHDMRINHN